MFIFKQVLQSKLNTVALQEVDLIFLKRLCFVMLILIPDVLKDCFDTIEADSGCPVAFLPFKRIYMLFVFHPFRRTRFDVANHIRHGQRRRQAGKKLNVIFDTTDLDQVSFPGA